MDITCDVCGSERPSVKSIRRHLLKDHGRVFISRRRCSAPFPGLQRELERAQEKLYQDRRNPANRQRNREVREINLHS